MSPKLKAFFQAWLINILAMLVAMQVVNGIRYDSWQGLLIAALLLGVLNAIVKPFLLLLSLPLLLLTLGLFSLVINALLLYTVSGLVKEFHVDSFWVACKAAMVMALISLVLNSLTNSGDSRVKIQTKKRDKGDQNIIDV